MEYRLPIEVIYEIEMQVSSIPIPLIRTEEKFRLLSDKLEELGMTFRASPELVFHEKYPSPRLKGEYFDELTRERVYVQ